MWAWGASTGLTACVPACCGAGRRASPGGVPRAVLRGVWGQAVPLFWPPVLGEGSRGPLPMCYGRGCAGLGPGTFPLACLPCAGLRTAGVAGGRLGVGASHCCEGRLVSGAFPLPAARPWGGQQGPLARVSRAWVVWPWRLSISPTTRALRRWRGGAPGGRASRRCWGFHARVCADQELVLSWLPILGAGSRGPPSTCRGHGCAGVGSRHCPFSVRALRGVARRRGGGTSARGWDPSLL